jgi:serine/threonine protein kinase
VCSVISLRKGIPSLTRKHCEIPRRTDALWVSLRRWPRYDVVVNALGRYELLRPLARGGMADVYLARRKVAGVEKRLVIKRMRRDRVADPKSLDLFVKEARLSMSLVQQNIVPVFDFGRIGEDVFLAMEHVDGKDLGSSLARESGATVSPIMAAFIAAECCAALEHAHRHAGIVHRDVTPRNILLSWSGDVKLADFGIAAVTGETTRGITGTPAYMAPEQARGEIVDGRSDVYGLGLVLWELLIGKRLRDGSDLNAMLMVARSGQLPTFDDPSVPAALRDIVRQATAMEIADRFASAQAMLDALDAFIVSARAATGSGSPRSLITAWLAERWQGWQQEDNAQNQLEPNGAIVTFLDDGVDGVLGAATQKSLAMTADELPQTAQATGSLDAKAQAPAALAPAAVSQPAPAPQSPPTKIGRTIAVLVVSAVVISATSIWATSRLSKNTSAVVDAALPSLTVAADATLAPVQDAAQLAPVMADAALIVAPLDAAARILPAAIRDARPAAGRADATQVAPVSASRTIMIGARPWANVTVDGDAKKHETPARIELALGVHQLTFSNPELNVTKHVTLVVTVTSDSNYVEDMTAQ